MNILRNYKYFINEAVDSNDEARSLEDIPNDVFETARKIAGDMFDRVRKPSFEFIPGTGLVMKFIVTQQDYHFIDENEPLKLEVTEGAKRKRTYDVELVYLDSISETFEVSYLVNFNMYEMSEDEIDDYDDDEDDDDEDLEDFDDIEDEVASRYKRIVSDWKKGSENKKPGEGTRKRLMKQAKQDLGQDLDEFDEDEMERNIKPEEIDDQYIQDLSDEDEL